LSIGLGTHLIVKLPRSGDSDGTFRSSSQAATYYPTTSLTTRKVKAFP